MRKRIVNNAPLLNKKGTDDDKKNTQDDGTTKIGISMPTKDLMRWNMDGDRMKNLLVTEGYLVDLQYADNDTSTQIAQIDFLIDSGCDVLVIAAIDGSSLTDVLEEAKNKNITQNNVRNQRSTIPMPSITTYPSTTTWSELSRASISVKVWVLTIM